VTYDFSELKRVQFSNLVALNIPARWTVETRPDSDWYCTEGDEESGSLSVVVDARRRATGAGSLDLKGIVEDIAAEFPSKFGGRMLENTVTEFRYGYLYRYVCDFDDDDGVALRTYRYCLVQYHADVMALIFVSLVILQSEARRSDMKELIGIVETAVQEIELLLYSDRRVTFPDPQELQTIKCRAALSLQIPARWTLETNREEEEGWCCYRRGEETGTLWIAINRFQRPSPAKDPDFSPRAYLDQMIATRLQNKVAPAFDSKVSETETGYLWSYDFNVIENGDDLHYFRHVFLVSDETEVAVVMFSFVVLEAQLGDRNMRGLISIVDREVRATKLTVLSDAARAKGAVAFPFPDTFDFGGKIQINLPGSTEVSLPNERGSFYCSFSSVTASMWVMTSDLRLSDNPFDDDGTIAPEIFESLEDYFIDGPKNEADITRFSRGFLVRSIYDDEDQSESQIDDPAQQWKRFGFRNHRWCYFHIGTEVVRQVQFLLMLPVREPDKRELVSLVRILDREIPQAKFPDLH
jgi:hypothetical protein